MERSTDLCELTENIEEKVSEDVKMMNLYLCVESAEVCVFSNNSNEAMSSWPVFLHSP